MSVVAVRGLSVQAGSGTDGATLIDDLSFDIEAGQRLGLIGESGSGKSLTALAILGLLPSGLVPSGSITVSGTEMIGSAERDRIPVRGSEAAIVFQEPLTALDPLMRVGRQVAEPVRRFARRRSEQLGKAEVREQVLEALREVRLPDPARIANAFPHEISGGQRQRVAIAIALAARPRLLIADEPTTALDVSVQAEVLDLLDRLVADRGMALLFISHDLAVVSRVADDVVVLQNGRAVDRGSLRELIAAQGSAGDSVTSDSVTSDPVASDPVTSEYTARLVAGARVLDDALDDPRRLS